MATFYEWGSIVLRLHSHCEDRVYFLPLNPQEASGTHLIGIVRMTGWDDRLSRPWSHRRIFFGSKLYKYLTHFMPLVLFRTP